MLFKWKGPGEDDFIKVKHNCLKFNCLLRVLIISDNSAIFKMHLLIMQSVVFQPSRWLPMKSSGEIWMNIFVSFFKPLKPKNYEFNSNLFSWKYPPDTYCLWREGHASTVNVPMTSKNSDFLSNKLNQQKHIFVTTEKRRAI